MKNWIVSEINKDEAKRIQTEYGLPPILAMLLQIRGITKREEIEDFLQNDSVIASPFEIKDMKKGADRILSAIDNDELICVYGDYDADGVTSTALLYSYLETVGANAMYYIPSRETEGYGMNKGAVDILAEKGVKLIVTVDNGIAAVEEIDYANSLGIDTVITDHHQPTGKIPNAVAVIDMHQSDCPSKYKMLSGVGVAFKLVMALEGENCDVSSLLDNYSDLLCIGTVGDIVELKSENRVFVKRGLVNIQESDRAGINALIETAGIAGKKITSGNVSFTLVPRINAVGRLGFSGKSVSLLLTDDENEAMSIAKQLNEDNNERKEIEKNILMKIKNIYERYHNVIIDNDMIDYIINLSEKYIFDRNRPDKEIDILDEVASRVGLRGCTSDNEIRDIKREICKLNKDKNSFIIDNNIDKAYSLRKRETELMSRLNDIELLSKNDKNKILLDDIASVISNRTGVPIYEIISNSGNVDDMKNSLKDIIVGEDKAIDNLMDITKRIRCGYNDRCYSLLFVGSSGVGKSRLAKEYANILVGADNLIRMDMSEYSDSTAVNKILGSSPGYIGYDDNKNILEEIRNKPNSVLLLDEIDKAHPNVINLFYQILEEGKIKNSKGREVRFNNVVVIMTSNVGFEKNGIGFNKKTDSSVISSLKGYFNTTFINRIDNIIVFDRLDDTSIKCIIKKRFEYIRDKYKDINIDINDNVIDEIVNKCEFYEFGARRIDKIISKDIENFIIDGVIRGDKNIYIDSIVKKNITS